jgi:hypothetical protein
MSRVTKSLDLNEETWDQMMEIGDLLGHDELEETMRVLIELGMKALSVSSRENRTVKLVGGERQYRGEPCKTCGLQRVVHGQEASVKIGVDDVWKSEGQPVHDEED